jgi:hypothetical protein
VIVEVTECDELIVDVDVREVAEELVVVALVPEVAE